MLNHLRKIKTFMALKDQYANDKQQLLKNIVHNSLKTYKNETLIKKVHNTYNDILQNLPQDKINIIEATTKNIVRREDIADCLDLMLNYLGLERLIRSFVDLQNKIHRSLQKDGIDDRMLIDILYTLTGEDMYMSIAMKNELTTAFYKMRLLTNSDMVANQQKEIQNTLYKINLN